MARKTVEGVRRSVESTVADAGPVREQGVRFAGQALVDSRAVAGQTRRVAGRELAVAGDRQRIAIVASACSVGLKSCEAFAGDTAGR